MKYRVMFSMCHCETTEVELEEEDIEGKSEGEIEALVESLARRQIRQEVTEWEAEDMLEIEEMEDQGNLVFLTGCSRPLLAANSPNFPLYHMLAILSSENSLCNLHKNFPFLDRSFYLQFIKKFVIIIIEIEREINLLKISKKIKKVLDL